MSESKYKPSAKQAKALKMIKELLGVTYTGTTFEDCSKFLDEHLKEAFSKLDQRPPSEKQSDCIAKMERALGEKFEGKTSKEASAFISSHMNAYRAMFSKGKKRG